MQQSQNKSDFDRGGLRDDEKRETESNHRSYGFSKTWKKFEKQPSRITFFTDRKQQRKQRLCLIAKFCESEYRENQSREENGAADFGQAKLRNY